MQARVVLKNPVDQVLQIYPFSSIPGGPGTHQRINGAPALQKRFFGSRICNYVSKSREKSYRKYMQDSTPQQQKHSLLFCDRGASLCNPGLLAGEFNVQRIKSVWSLQMDQIPAVPTGLEVGTNPPSLPTGDQRWERQ